MELLKKKWTLLCSFYFLNFGLWSCLRCSRCAEADGFRVWDGWMMVRWHQRQMMRLAWLSCSSNWLMHVSALSKRASKPISSNLKIKGQSPGQCWFSGAWLRLIWTSMSVFFIVGTNCTLAASHAHPLSRHEYADGTDGRTDARPRYITLSARSGQRNNFRNVGYKFRVNGDRGKMKNVSSGAQLTLNVLTANFISFPYSDERSLISRI